MGDCVRGVNIFVLAVSIDRTLATPTATAALHLASSWKPGCDSICLYARHQVQADFGGRTLVNGHTEYLVVNAQARWPAYSSVTQVSNMHRILCFSLRNSQGLLKLSSKKPTIARAPAAGDRSVSLPGVSAAGAASSRPGMPEQESIAGSASDPEKAVPSPAHNASSQQLPARAESQAERDRESARANQAFYSASMKESYDRDFATTSIYKVGDVVGLKPEGGDAQHLKFGKYLPCVVVSVGRDQLHGLR